jgi:cell division protein FtsW (lipid II flippase)
MFEQAQSYWQNLSLNVFLMIFCVGLALVYAFVLRRRYMMGLFISMYLSFGLWKIFDLTTLVAKYWKTDFFAKNLLIFLILLILTYSLIYFFVVKSFQSGAKLWKNLVYGFFLSIVFLKMNLVLLPITYQSKLSPLAQKFVLSGEYTFLWYLAPLLLLLIFKSSPGGDDNQ